MSVLSRMANQLTLTICILVITIIAKAVPNCNETLQNIITTNGDKQSAVLIKSGSLVNSNNVFVFKISQKPKNIVTFILDKPLYITGIGIRQRFNMTEVENECKSSLYQDPWASYNITYTNSQSDKPRTLNYPPGVCLGIINPSTMLPYQEIPTGKIHKKILTVAIIPTMMRTITIEKKVVQEHGQIYNSGTFCLQFEFYGCQSATDLLDSNRIVLEYQMYQPVPLPGSVESSDSTYTGICSEGTCTGGTGKLTDKQLEFTSYTAPDMFVLWELSAPNNNVAGRSISGMKMQFILNDVYFIKVVKIYGTVKIGKNSDISSPSFVAINGITVDTSVKVHNGDTYIIYLFPFIKTNAIQFQFYVDAEYNVTQRIAFSEITIEEGDSDSHCEEPQASRVGAIIVVVLIAIIFLTLFITSLVLNLYFLIQYCNKKMQDKIHYITHQLSENNSYTRTVSTGNHRERIDTNYESIEFDVSAVNKEYKGPPEQEYSKILAQTDRTKSVIDMPPNPTYVSTLPLSPIEEMPGYSRLVHFEGKEVKRNPTIESNTLPRIKEKSSSQVFTAAERRKSYTEQHDLSDLK